MVFARGCSQNRRTPVCGDHDPRRSELVSCLEGLDGLAAALLAAGADPDPAACGAAYNPAADATQTLSPLLAAASAGRAAAVELLLDALRDPAMFSSCVEINQ